MSSSHNPLDIRLERFEQPFQRGEAKRLFPPIDMTMIALAALVVVSQDTIATDDERQPILERMRTPGTGTGKCHNTTSKKAFSLRTVRDFSMSNAFMLLSITADCLLSMITTHRGGAVANYSNELLLQSDPDGMLKIASAEFVTSGV